MSSSPTTPVLVQLPDRPDLLTLFGSVPDPRHRRGVRHALPVILALGVAAVLTGARSFAAIGEWVADQPGPTPAGSGVGTGPRPTESTIRRVFTRLDADLLDRVLGAHLWTRTGWPTVGGSSRSTARRSVVPAPRTRSLRTWSPRSTTPVGPSLGPVAVAAKSNEIPAVRDLLATFDLKAVVVSVDAMHTQTD